jgi:hypothetical protein
MRVGEDDDDERATFPIPERSPVPPSPVPAPPPAVNERSAPTEPPSRVIRRPVAKPAAKKERKDGLVGSLVKSVALAVGAFLLTLNLVPILLGDAEESQPAPAEKAAEPAPAPAPAPAEPAPAETSKGLVLRVESMDAPSGVTLEPTQGLVEIELAEPSSIKVDGSPMGRFDRRRLLLAPGPHRIEIEGDRGSGVLELDVAAGRAVRVVSDGAGAPASSAAPSAG